MTPLREIALLFLKLGTIAVGGPAAHIAMMEDEVVRRRRWISRDEFLDLLGATNLIPGPNSTELAIHIGRMRGGWRGLLVAGACFILPAAVIVGGFAWGYVRYGRMPEVSAVLYGVKPVVIAVVVQALWGLARAAVKRAWLAALGAASVVALVVGAHELAVLAAAAAVGAAVAAGRRFGVGPAPMIGLLPLPASSLLEPPATVSLGAVLAIFAKIGSVLFGSGYVLLAFLRSDFVERLGWLTERQLLDAVAVGQVTPGPVFTTATFVGYVLAGAPGAVVATVGIFLPAFVFVALSAPLLPRLRRSAVAGGALDGVNVASLALMAVVTWHLGRAALVDVPTVLLATGAAVLLIRWRVNSAWLVIGGATTGWIVGG